MGMFNNIQCEMPLPDTPEDITFKKYGFQTKRLGENLMDSYRITVDGTLEKHHYHYEPTGKWFKYNFDKGHFGEKIYYDTPADPPREDEYNSLEYDGPYPEQERIDDGWHHFDFNGAFNFYASRTDERGNDTWYEYVAYVEQGQVFKLIRDHDREFRMKNYP